MNRRPFLLSLALTTTAVATPPPAMVIGEIEIYGLRNVSEQQVRELLPVSAGMAVADLDLSGPKMEAEIARSLGVHQVDVSLLCCSRENSALLYVGIAESEDQVPQFNPAPTANLELPAGMLELQERIEKSLINAVMAGDAGEDWSEGHSLLTNEATRSLQRQNVAWADAHFEQLVDVLQRSATYRDIAAQVLAYASDKKAVVPHLEAAVLDPDPEVRNNAMRALAILADYSDNHPELELSFRTDLYARLLDSPEFGDRNKATMVLLQLTEQDNPNVLAGLRETALPSLMEMCAWQWEGHAWAPCKLLERVVGLEPGDVLHPKAVTLDRARQLLGTTPARSR